MKILSKVKSLMAKRPPADEDDSSEKPETAEVTKTKAVSDFFVSQTLEAINELEIDGGTYICASPEFECYFKKKTMPLFEEKRGYIQVAFDQANNVTHVCGLLPRLQQEKDRNKVEEENITLSKMPDCLLSQAIAKISRVPVNKMSRAGKVVHQGQIGSKRRQTSHTENVVYPGQETFKRQQTSHAGKVVNKGRVAPARQQNSNLVYDPNFTARSLRGIEKEWLESMHAALINGEYQILLHLLQHSITARGFRERIEHFLATKKELEPGSCQVIINSFEYLAREFQFREQMISVAQIGSGLEQKFNLKPKDTFSTIVELFFCLGYEREIKGYTTGFVERV